MLLEFKRFSHKKRPILWKLYLGGFIMFKNKLIFGHIYATRFIASWINVGGQLKTRKDIGDFRNWLSSLNLAGEDIHLIVELATDGKLELEDSARKYLNEL